MCATDYLKNTFKAACFFIIMLTNRILVGLDRTWQVQVSKSWSESAQLSSGRLSSGVDRMTEDRQRGCADVEGVCFDLMG